MEERSEIRVMQRDNLRGLLNIMRMDRVLNAWVRGYRMANGMDERIDERDLR